MNHPARRAIRSYVLRQGRTTLAQARALRELLPRYGISYAPQAIDLDRVFGRTAPKVLEIGFGMGDTLAAMAATHPDTDYIGIEVHGPGVGSLLNRLQALELTNVRVIQHDAVEVLSHMIQPASLDGVHILFPDPWPKKRHHKRRLLQPAFVQLLVARMRPGASLDVATDCEDYALQIIDLLSQHPALENTARQTVTRPPTKFERRGVALGHRVWATTYRKVVPKDP
jgi:tRNA (guanine-N7-)-methyltransferase